MAIFAYRPRITQSSGTIEYESGQGDTLLCFDLASPVPVETEIEIVFPSSPNESDLFGITTTKSIANLKLTSQYIPIVAAPEVLDPGNAKCWAYSFESNKWITHP